MNELPESHDQPLDDQFSEFIDLLLSSDNEIATQESMTDDDLAKLKRTAIQMKAAARMARPGSAASMRVRTRLLKEWKQQNAQSKRLSFKAFFGPLPRFALAGGLVVILLLSVVTFVIPASIPLTGAAKELQAWTPLFILLGVVLIIVLFWFDRRK